MHWSKKWLDGVHDRPPTLQALINMTHKACKYQRTRVKTDAQLQLQLRHVRYDVLFDGVEKFKSKKRVLLSMTLVDRRETTHYHVRIADRLHFIHVVAVNGCVEHAAMKTISKTKQVNKKTSKRSVGLVSLSNKWQKW